MKNEKLKLMAVRMNAEQVKADPQREYNPTSWENIVDRYNKYSNVEFYKILKGNGYEYDRFIVVYTLDEGLRLLGKLSYSSSLTNGGFYYAYIRIFDENYEYYPENTVEIITKKINSKDENGLIIESAINNSEIARRYMVEQSKSYNQIWTKEFFYS